MIRPWASTVIAVGEREDDVHVVLDDDLGHAARLDLLEQVDGAVGVGARHAGGGLVEQQQARVLDQAHGQLQPPLVAARQARRLLVMLVLQADILERLVRLVVQLALALEVLPGADAEGAVALGEGRDHDVVSTVSSGKISGVWNTRATPSWLISCGVLAGERLAVEA